MGPAPHLGRAPGERQPQLCPHLPGGSLLITLSPALSICRTTWNQRFLSYFTLSLADDMPT